MSDALPPLADMTLDEAMARRGDLLRAITGGQLSVRYSDGTMVTYRSMAEMKTALTEIEGRIAAAVAVFSNNAPAVPVRAVRFVPSGGWR